MVSTGIEPVADPEPTNRRREPAYELVGDRVLDEEALHGRADLAAVVVSARDCARHRAVEVRVGADDHRVRAAELERDPGHAVRRESHDTLPCR